MMIKKFDDINVSTSTVIVPTNLEMNLEWLYDALSVTNFDTKCKTVRSFQTHVVSTNPHIGTITMVQYQHRLKGFKINKKKTKQFRNALSMVMFVGKLITVKVPIRGKLQMTGCTSEVHAEIFVKVLWDFLQQFEQSDETYRLLNNPNQLDIIFMTVMTNIVFKLGFRVNRQKLDKHMNDNTEFNSLLETSFGYTGVNIKKPFVFEPDITPIRKMTHVNGKWTEEKTTYNTLPIEDMEKELNSKRRNTFLVFHSGTAIMSGLSSQYMREVYDTFIDIIEHTKHVIEEVIPE